MPCLSLDGAVCVNSSSRSLQVSRSRCAKQEARHASSRILSTLSANQLQLEENLRMELEDIAGGMEA